MFMQFKDFKIIESQNYNKVPISCPVCNILLAEFDKRCFKKNACCEACSLHFVQPNLKAWKDGWRPDKAEIDLMLKNKALTPTYIMRGL